MPILSTVKRYATLIKWSGIILLVLGVVYAVYDYSKSKEMLSQLNDENSELEYRLDNVKSQIDQQTKQITAIRSDYKEIELTYSRQLEEINELRKLTVEYIQNNKPEVEQELNTRFQNLTDRMQCLSGDKSKCGS
jgi:chromosome segregation ATPase